MLYKELRTGQLVYELSSSDYSRNTTNFYIVLGINFNSEIQRHLYVTGRISSKVLLYKICSISVESGLDLKEKSVKDFLRYQMMVALNKPMNQESLYGIYLTNLETVAIRPKAEDTKLFLTKSRMVSKTIEKLTVNCQYVENIIPVIDKILLQRASILKRTNEPRNVVTELKKYQLYYHKSADIYYICLNETGTGYLGLYNRNGANILAFLLLIEREKYNYIDAIRKNHLILSDMKAALEDTNFNLYDIECNRKLLKDLEKVCN